MEIQGLWNTKWKICMCCQDTQIQRNRVHSKGKNTKYHAYCNSSYVFIWGCCVKRCPNPCDLWLPPPLSSLEMALTAPLLLQPLWPHTAPDGTVIHSSSNVAVMILIVVPPSSPGPIVLYPKLLWSFLKRDKHLYHTIPHLLTITELNIHPKEPYFCD